MILQDGVNTKNIKLFRGKSLSLTMVVIYASARILLHQWHKAFRCIRDSRLFLGVTVINRINSLFLPLVVSHLAHVR